MPKINRRTLGARNYRNFSDETLQKALESIRNGLYSIRDASRVFNIPASTLSRKNRGLYPKRYGGQTALSQEEEESLVNGILVASNWGYPFTAYDVKLTVKNYLDRRGVKERKFVNNVPGRKWLERFLEKHRHTLTKRYCENVKRSRTAVSEETITSYFKEMEVSLKDVVPTHLINYDETNFTDDPGKIQVIVKRGVKHPERCVDSSKASVSVMMAGSAAGIMLPPYVVYRSEHLYDSWTEHGPPGCRYGRTKRGWFDTTVFEDWFSNILIPFVKKLGDGPKVLVGDNLSSHLSLFVINECQKYNIRFVFLPPNSTHLCQPLDVAFFRPLKTAWRKVLEDWKLKNRGTIPKNIFPSLLKAALESVGTNAPINLKSGFKAAGIYPYNPSEVLKRLPTWIKRDNDNDCWLNSMHDVLEKYRFPDEKRQPKRKKRLNVAPGKSVTEFFDKENIDADLNSMPSTSTQSNVAKEQSLKGKRLKKKQSKIYKEVNEDSDSENGQYSVHDSSSDYNSITDIIDTETDDIDQLVFSEQSEDVHEESLELANNSFEEQPENIDLEERTRELEKESLDNSSNQYSIGDYLIVKFSLRKGSKGSDIFYIGCVQEVLPTDSQTQYYCKFLRNCKEARNPEKDVFVFPDVEDLSLIDSQQIVQRLEMPKVVRGRYTFKLKECENYRLK